MTRKTIGIFSALAVFAATAYSQSAGTSGTIQAQGSATLSVQPDQVQLNVTVSTDAPTAQQAAQQNATQTSAVLNALKQVLGSNGNVQTVGYSLYPRYGNTGSAIVGYTAVNSVQVTSPDLSSAGPLIDAAGQNGASGIGGLAFGLHDPDPARQQALTAASKQALAHAAAIASGLGAKVGPVVSAQETATAPPIVMTVAPTTTTPIQTGYVSVTATVTVTVQLQ